MQTLSKLYYSPSGYWRGESAVDHLHDKTKIDKKVIRDWLKKQAIWQIYLPGPAYVPRPTSTSREFETPNDFHQMDVLYLPWDKVKRKTYKYALTVVDVASRYHEAEPLVSKTADSTRDAIVKIYARSPLSYPKTLRVDAGTEFKGAFKKWMASKNVEIIVGEPGNHRSQGIVERFNRTLAERLFGHQYAQEMLNPESRNTQWVERLPSVIKAINDETTRLIAKAPSEAVKLKQVRQSPANPVKTKEQQLPQDAMVRYLYYPGEQEGGTARRATDPIWSVDIFNVEKRTSQFKMIEGKKVTTGPTLYYLQDGPKRSFVRQELQVVPEDTQLPPN